MASIAISGANFRLRIRGIKGIVETHHCSMLLTLSVDVNSFEGSTSDGAEISRSSYDL